MDTIGTWVWQIGVKKAVSKAVQLVVAWLLAHGLGDLGVTVNVDQLTLAAFAGLEILRNWLKLKFPKYLGWL